VPGNTNFTVLLDGKTAPAPNAFPPTYSTTPPIYNVTLYNIQSLPLSFHEMTITFAPWGGGYSELAFDYAFVNETKPSPPPSPSPTPSPSLSTPAAPHHSRFPVGAVVGVVGGLVVIATIVFALVYFRRKRHASLITETQPNSAGLQPLAAPQPTMAYVPTSSTFLTATHLHHPSGPVSSQDNYGNSQPASASSGDFLIPSIPPVNATNADDNPSGTTYSPPREADFNRTSENRTSSLQSNDPGNQITDEQADFVNTLYSHNIPAPAIARVMERMIGGQVDTASESLAGAPGVSRRDTTATMGPPGYAPYDV